MGLRRKSVRDGWERALKSMRASQICRAWWVGIPIMGRPLLVAGNPGLASLHKAGGLLVSDDQAPCSDQNQQRNLGDLGQQEAAATRASQQYLPSEPGSAFRGGWRRCLAFYFHPAKQLLS